MAAEEQFDTRFDISIRLTCCDCAAMIADDMRRRYPMATAKSIFVSQTKNFHSDRKSESLGLRTLSGVITFWPDVKPCAEHAKEWDEAQALLPPISATR